MDRETQSADVVRKICRNCQRSFESTKSGTRALCTPCRKERKAGKRS